MRLLAPSLEDDGNRRAVVMDILRLLSRQFDHFGTLYKALSAEEDMISSRPAS